MNPIARRSALVLYAPDDRKRSGPQNLGRLSDRSTRLQACSKPTFASSTDQGRLCFTDDFTARSFNDFLGALVALTCEGRIPLSWPLPLTACLPIDAAFTLGFGSSME